MPKMQSESDDDCKFLCNTSHFRFVGGAKLPITFKVQQPRPPDVLEQVLTMINAYQVRGCRGLDHNQSPQFGRSSSSRLSLLSPRLLSVLGDGRRSKHRDRLLSPSLFSLDAADGPLSLPALMQA